LTGRAPLARRLHFWIGGRNRASALAALSRFSLSYPSPHCLHQNVCIRGARPTLGIVLVRRMHSPQLGQIGAFGSKFMPAGYQVLPTETVTRITINSRLHFWSIVAKFLAAELISIAGTIAAISSPRFSAMGGLSSSFESVP
jgi:hypothetical protein